MPVSHVPDVKAELAETPSNNTWLFKNIFYGLLGKQNVLNKPYQVHRRNSQGIFVQTHAWAWLLAGGIIFGVCVVWLIAGDPLEKCTP